MVLRALVVSLAVLCSAIVPVHASQPEGTAGKLLAMPIVSSVGENGLPGVACGGFAWYGYFFPYNMDAAGIVTVEMALIPFPTAGMVFGLDQEGGQTFVNLSFADGNVQGLPYNRNGWNDVTIQLRRSTQDYILRVNGAQAGPFPFADFCAAQGECSTVQAFRFHSPGSEEVGWIDSIAVYEDTATDHTPFYEESFATCYGPQATVGAMLISDPPRRQSRRH